MTRPLTDTSDLFYEVLLGLQHHEDVGATESLCWSLESQRRFASHIVVLSPEVVPLSSTPMSQWQSRVASPELMIDTLPVV